MGVKIQLFEVVYIYFRFIHTNVTINFSIDNFFTSKLGLIKCNITFVSKSSLLQSAGLSTISPQRCPSLSPRCFSHLQGYLIINYIKKTKLRYTNFL